MTKHDIVTAVQEDVRFMAALAELDSAESWLLFINAGFSMATARSLVDQGKIEATLQMGMPAARLKRPRQGKPDISPEAVAARVALLRDDPHVNSSDSTTDMLEALAADRDRLANERDDAAEQIHLLRGCLSADAQLLSAAIARAERAEAERDNATRELEGAQRETI